jgi:hypothetical protein
MAKRITDLWNYVECCSRHWNHAECRWKTVLRVALSQNVARKS